MKDHEFSKFIDLACIVSMSGILCSPSSITARREAKFGHFTAFANRDGLCSGLEVPIADATTQRQ